MTFRADDHVFVASLNKTGRFIRLLSRGRCQVLVDHLRIECRLEELQAIQPKKQRERRRPVEVKLSLNAAPLKAPQTVSLDLHGMRTDQAVTALEHALSDALLCQAERLEIIHGIGTGAVATAVENYLQNSRHTRQFFRDPQNPGVTWVVF